MHNKALFIFRRDLRLHDNTGLIAALREATTVIPCFIFDPIQVGNKNDYRSMNAIEFMVQSLQDLNAQLKKKNGKLYLFHGATQNICAELIKKNGIDAIYCNRDYTPFSIKRDKEIAALCEKNDIAFHTFDDALLNPPEAVLTQSGTPYSVFTPYWKAAAQKRVAKEQTCRQSNFYHGRIAASQTEHIYKKVCPKNNPHLALKGGRTEGLKILKGLKEFKTYQKTRDIPAIDTTLLSAHNKFGTLSIREVYAAMKEELGASAPKGLIRQLYWRDFYYQVAFHHPYVFGKPFRQEYNALTWCKSKKDFERWCTGTTGFPIVDAGMRQLNETGWMHNRTRMIVASFLTKDLQLDWRWGEKYFAQQLVDYDPCVNNGNWQWAASTGCDAQPYFRIFNPWLQQKKFDPECVYIKRWVKELKEVPINTIHQWYKHTKAIKGYPAPMVDHDKARKETLTRYKKARA